MEKKIYVDPPRSEGYGWTVFCEICDYDQRMLSEEGADTLAKAHGLRHTPEIEKTVNEVYTAMKAADEDSLKELEAKRYASRSTLYPE